MLTDINFTELWGLPAGGAIVYLLVKVVWPRITTATDATLSDARAASHLMAQLQSERDRAVARADAADERANTLFSELHGVKAQLQIMTAQLAALQESNLFLKRRLNELIGGGDDGDQSLV